MISKHCNIDAAKHIEKNERNKLFQAPDTYDRETGREILVNCNDWWCLTYETLLKIHKSQGANEHLFQHMMTSSNGNIFRVTGPLCGEFTGHRWQWRGTLMFSLICVWINGWVNNREAGDLRRHCAHYDVTVINFEQHFLKLFNTFEPILIHYATKILHKTTWFWNILTHLGLVAYICDTRPEWLNDYTDAITKVVCTECTTFRYKWFNNIRSSEWLRWVTTEADSGGVEIKSWPVCWSKWTVSLSIMEMIGHRAHCRVGNDRHSLFKVICNSVGYQRLLVMK